jgi:hypothetical protein
LPVPWNSISRFKENTVIRGFWEQKSEENIGYVHLILG